jgi:hypothetical protein
MYNVQWKLFYVITVNGITHLLLSGLLHWSHLISIKVDYFKNNWL